MKTLPKISKETLHLENFLKEALEGEIILFDSLEAVSGVKMDAKGRGYLKTALNKLKLPYEAIRGKGLRLVCPDNALNIVAHKIIKIDNSVKKAEKTTKQVRDKTFDKLNMKEQEQITFLTAWFGSVRAFSNSAKTLFGKEQIKIGTVVK
jgi:hypothetical protein